MEPKSKTVEVQTDYRESGAQTVPFTHDSFNIDANNIPEVLEIAHFTYGNGLPASMAEMELIEQMRDKRAFDRALPPTSDEACFTLRRRLMEDAETRQWNQRNNVIKQLGNDRLNLLQSALLDREKRVEESHA